MVKTIEVKNEKGICRINEAHTEIKIPGLCREYTFVHLSDLHIAHATESDTEEAQKLAQARNEFWEIQGAYFVYNRDGEIINRLSTIEVNELLAERIREISPDAVFFTGDTVDYPAVSSFKRAKKYLDSLGCDCFLATGNHDCIICEDGETVAPELTNALNEVICGDGGYSLHPFDKFDVVSFNDGLIKVTENDVKILEERIKVRRPMILLLHAPLYFSKAFSAAYPMWGKNWTLGEPQQSAENIAFRELILKNKELFPAIFAGHIHKSSGNDIDDTSGEDSEPAQYTAAPAFTGFIRVIKVH